MVHRTRTTTTTCNSGVQVCTTPPFSRSCRRAKHSFLTQPSRQEGRPRSAPPVPTFCGSVSPLMGQRFRRETVVAIQWAMLIQKAIDFGAVMNYNFYYCLDRPKSFGSSRLWLWKYILASHRYPSGVLSMLQKPSSRIFQEHQTWFSRLRRFQREFIVLNFLQSSEQVPSCCV